MLKPVPNLIGNSKPLFIAETGGVFDLIERDGEKVEIVLIAVCQYNKDEGYYLFGCDKDFKTHTDFYYDELNDALEDAKRIYGLKEINWKEWLHEMQFADTTEIYVSLIDGVQCWFPAKAKPLGDNQFLILNNNEFERNDYSSLPEFIPGDTVSLAGKTFQDGDKKNVATTLIKSSLHPDKMFFEFLYHATFGDIRIDKSTLEKYKLEIERIKKESSAGRYFYPAILEMIDKLDKIEITT